MSVWATWLDFDAADHDPSCGKWVQQRPAGVRKPTTTFHLDGSRSWLDQTRACTCRCGPIRYQGSHVLPSDEDERDGCLSLAAVNTWIERPGQPFLPEDADEDSVWPWLRVSLNEQDVVLDVAQVRQLHETLSRWLDRVVT